MALLATLLSIGILAFALRLYMGREAEARLRPGSPRCAGNGESPAFNLPWERLRDDWKEMIRMQPRVELVASDREQRHFAYLQRSAGFRFPDVVTVEFMALEGGRSSLAIHSRSRYGYTDLGTNRARVTAGIARIELI